MMLRLFALIALLTCSPATVSAADAPRVLIVTAHPDDEAMFAATVYRITQALDGTVDLALVTDGAGGYRFSTLANRIYNLDLTDPEVAHRHLPAIRKQELMAGGRIIGIANYYFLDEPDEGKTEHADSILQFVWDIPAVSDRLDRILAEGDYDFVFTHLPIQPFHAHHKAATILALEAVSRMAQDERPIVLGSFPTGGLDDVVAAFEVLDGYPITRIDRTDGPWTFDRATPFGTDNRLHYGIVANWLIAEHKSQGTMQLFLQGEPAVERFWSYSLNGPGSTAAIRELFDRIRTAPHPD
jgi:LmbE family N-acetylglucosaminyl deacetylase